MLNFGLGMSKFLLETNLREVLRMLSALLWKRSHTYGGNILLATYFIIFALFKNTLCSKDRIFKTNLASSKSVYSFPMIILHPCFCRFVVLEISDLLNFSK